MFCDARAVRAQGAYTHLSPTRSLTTTGARVKVKDLTKVAEIEEAEKMKMKRKVEKICKHGINVFINRQLIYNWPEQLFADAGIMSIEHADFDGIERLGAVLGGEICSTFDHPELVKLGRCKLIEEIIIGEEKFIKFSGVQSGAACTIVLRGASPHLLDEAERSLHDALCVLTETVKKPRVTLGGGCAEMLMAQAVEKLVPPDCRKEGARNRGFRESASSDAGVHCRQRWLRLSGSGHGASRRAPQRKLDGGIEHVERNDRRR